MVNALAELDERLVTMQRAATTLANAVRRVRAAARSGHIGDVQKGMPAIRQRTEEALEVARHLDGAWTFDVPAYMASGGYLDELKAAAADAGIELFEKDGRIYCFPVLLRLDARDASARVGRRLERRLHPGFLAGLLATEQKRPQRFSEQRFLDLLHRAYRQLAGADWRLSERGAGPVVALSGIHEVLTLLPGADYPMAEFGRDLLLLDRQPDLRTRDGARFEFPSSTIGKERVGRVTVYDEHGREYTYIGLRFVREN